MAFELGALLHITPAALSPSSFLAYHSTSYSITQQDSCFSFQSKIFSQVPWLAHMVLLSLSEIPKSLSQFCLLVSPSILGFSKFPLVLKLPSALPGLFRHWCVACYVVYYRYANDIPFPFSSFCSHISLNTFWISSFRSLPWKGELLVVHPQTDGTSNSTCPK